MAGFSTRHDTPPSQAPSPIFGHSSGALMLEQTDEWAVGRRYLSLESLAHLGDTEPRQLAAVAS